MKVSLQMIMDKRGSLDGKLHIRDHRHGFYSMVRLLTSATEYLEDDVLYLQVDALSKDLHINPNACVLYNEKPDQMPHVDYGWLESSADTFEVFNRLLAIFDEYQQCNQKMREALAGEHAAQRIV